MIIERSERFRRSYSKLAHDDKERVRKALRFFAADMRHPPLRVKKLQGTADVWEGRASRELRFTFELIDGGVRLRTVGHHDAALRSP